MPQTVASAPPPLLPAPPPQAASIDAKMTMGNKCTSCHNHPDQANEIIGRGSKQDQSVFSTTCLSCASSTIQIRRSEYGEIY